MYVVLLSVVFAANASETSIENAKLPVLWDFGADKCIPCKKMAPILEKMEKEYKGEIGSKIYGCMEKRKYKTRKRE